MDEAERIICRDLRPADLAMAQLMIDEGPRYHTLLLAPTLKAARAGNPNVWWYGAFGAGPKLLAVMGIDGHHAVIHGTADTAIETMARELLKAQQFAIPTPTARHQLLGERHTMARFWSVFKSIGRQVVLDRLRPLLGSTPDLASPSKRATVRLATPADTKVIFEFSADAILEAHGLDPRRMARAAHERHCQEVIAAGRQLIAAEGPKPVLIAELTPHDNRTIMLDKVFVPKPMRAMPRLIGGALVAAVALEPLAGKEVLFFAENDGLAAAARQAGFAERAQYQVVAMHG